jgi:hypothetical protein
MLTAEKAPDVGHAAFTLGKTARRHHQHGVGVTEESTSKWRSDRPPPPPVETSRRPNDDPARRATSLISLPHP